MKNITIDQAINLVKSGQPLIQHTESNREYVLVYLFNVFWLETYEIFPCTYKRSLVGVEALEESVARFSLSGKFEA